GQILGYMGDRQAYFATARIVEVTPDPARADHFYADVDYTSTSRGRSRSKRGSTITSRSSAGSRHLRAQRINLAAVRGHGLLRLRLAMTPVGRLRPRGAAASRERIRCHLDGGFRHGAWRDGGRTSALPSYGGFAELPATFERPSVERLVARLFRDAAFSGAIKAAYHDACAVTGLKIVNGRGRSEAPAAHIRPVMASRPDSLRNGIACFVALLAMTRNRPLDVRPRSHLDRRAAAVIASATKQSIS